MPFPYDVYCLAALCACATVMIALPLWRRWCLRTGLVDDPGHRKIHDQPIPLAGGLAVITGLTMPLLLAALWLGLQHANLGSQTASKSGGIGILSGLLAPSTFSLLKYGLSQRVVELGGIVFGAFGMLFLGWLDDKHELSPAVKFAGQLVVSAIVAAAGVRLTLFVPSLVFSYAVTILWILTLVNAFNFMDNMNGLCTGLGAIAAWYFAITAAIDGQYLVALIALLTCGALLGFLPYNFPNASAFLGDAGSHLVGYLLAVLAILPHFHTPQHPRPWAVLIPLLILAVPLVDLAWVVVVRWRNGQPFYRGDTNHLSHRLVRHGLSRTSAVLFIWLLAALVGALACLC